MEKVSCPHCGEDNDDMIDIVAVYTKRTACYCNSCGREFVVKPEELKKEKS